MTHDLIKELRELTGAGMLEIKESLIESNNDKEKAIEILRKKGALKLGKKSDRSAKEGLIEAYVHPGSRIGVLLELNCETDFVARTGDFKALAKELAMHIAAANPLYITPNDVPMEVIEKEKEIYKEQSKEKASGMANKIIEGKLIKFYEEVCLLEQPFIKNPDIKIKVLLAEAVAKIGENIQVKRFSRFVLGN
ncbi:MAG: translation elongation factor Ts [Candidatus Doudnabacteria bacterium]|nr:translation elongation factor Ts [Candidatus Doudnabacteria bacterium]